MGSAPYLGIYYYIYIQTSHIIFVYACANAWDHLFKYFCGFRLIFQFLALIAASFLWYKCLALIVAKRTHRQRT